MFGEEEGGREGGLRPEDVLAMFQWEVFKIASFTLVLYLETRGEAGALHIIVSGVLVGNFERNKDVLCFGPFTLHRNTTLHSLNGYHTRIRLVSVARLFLALNNTKTTIN